MGVKSGKKVWGEKNGLGCLKGNEISSPVILKNSPQLGKNFFIYFKLETNNLMSLYGTLLDTRTLLATQYCKLLRSNTLYGGLII